MNSAHWHLLLNHFPIIGSLIGTGILLTGVAKKNDTIQQAGLIIIFIMSLISIPAFLTGEPAEEQIENVPGIIKAAIEQHEEAAEMAFWSMLLAGLFSGLAIIAQVMRKFKTKSLVLLSLIISILSVCLMARTGYLGGLIRHTELSGNSKTPTSPINDTSETEEND